MIGYRQFLDVVMWKSVVDVLLGEEMSWTGPERTGELESALERESLSD